MDTDLIIKIVVASIIILIIVILIYYIISYFVSASSKIEDTGSPDENVLNFNKFIIKKSLDSKNLNSDYIKKYKVTDNYRGYENYNVISNIHDNRNLFQAPDGDFYVNIKE
jgi:hypothetical protein